MVDLEVQETKFYTMSELQTLMHIGKNTAYKLVKLKGFPVIKIGKKILIPQNELNKWIDENCGSEINI